MVEDVDVCWQKGYWVHIEQCKTRCHVHKNPFKCRQYREWVAAMDAENGKKRNQTKERINGK